MSQLSDKELQGMLEQGITPGDDTTGVQAYSLLFSELRREPEAGLPFNFAAKVTATVKLQQELRPAAGYYLLALLVGAGIIAAVYFVLTAARNDYAIPLFISKYKWAMLFCLLTYLVARYLDQRSKIARLAGSGK